MALIRIHRSLLLLVTMIFGIGHTHQVAGRFDRHDHDVEIADHPDGDAPDHHDRQKETDHMLADHAPTAVVPAVIGPPAVARRPVGQLVVSGGKLPEAPVAGIQHPPQLRNS